MKFYPAFRFEQSHGFAPFSGVRKRELSLFCRRPENLTSFLFSPNRKDVASSHRSIRTW